MEASRRDRLKTRLLEILDTVENEAEIAGVVIQLRQLLGQGGFAQLGAVADQVVMIHPDDAIVTGLRALGFMLQWGQHSDTRVTDSMHRFGHALVNGEAVSRDDLILGLAFLPHAISPQEQLPIERFDLTGDLRRNMDTLNSLVRRR
jgi:hypothetical protein